MLIYSLAANVHLIFEASISAQTVAILADLKSTGKQYLELKIGQGPCIFPLVALPTGRDLMEFLPCSAF